MVENFSWNFNEADAYKRRIFPKSFLQNESSQYPCYVFQSPLSKAFNSYTHIDAEVEISEFVLDYEWVIPIKEQLVTSTSEFIQNIRRAVFKKIKVPIQPKPAHDLILKTSGSREYFEGNYQLLQYERVRICLRKKTKLKLILTQIPKNYRSKFPPLYKNLIP